MKGQHYGLSSGLIAMARCAAGGSSAKPAPITIGMDGESKALLCCKIACVMAIAHQRQRISQKPMFMKAR